MTGEFSAQRTSNELNILISIFVFHYPCYHVITNMILFVVFIAVLCTLTSVLIANKAQFVVIVVFLFLVYHVFQHHRVYWMLCAQAYYSVVLLLHGQFPTILAIQTPSVSLGLALLTLSWDKNWDSHSLVNGYPSFYPRIALVAPSPEGLHCHNVRDGVSNHQLHDCLLKRLFSWRSKTTSKLCVTGFCEGNHRWPVNFQHKWPVTRKMFPFDNVIMRWQIQIRRKPRLTVQSLLAITSHQIFANATAAQLWCHLQNFVVTAALGSRWKQNEMSIEFELQLKSR